MATLCPKLLLKSKVGGMELLSEPHSSVLIWTRSQSITYSLALSYTHNLPHGIQEREQLQPLLHCKHTALAESLSPPTPTISSQRVQLQGNESNRLWCH